MSDRFLNITETAVKVGCSKTTIYRLERAGDFPAKRLLGAGSGRVVYSCDEIEAWMKSRPLAGRV